MMYILRLDDACEKQDVARWTRIEVLLDAYGIIPIVGVIPNCQDPKMDCYPVDDKFWEKVHRWVEKRWIIAMHGYNHVYGTDNPGINPVNTRSEFAGESLEVQRSKIRAGFKAFDNNGIKPQVFFAPAHTFDHNTILALKLETEIRIISDTIANKPYSYCDITFVPQQSGHVRKLPFKTTTFCYHPNNMKEKDFSALEGFINKHRDKFGSFPLQSSQRQASIFDKFLKSIYFAILRVRRKGSGYC